MRRKAARIVSSILSRVLFFFFLLSFSRHVRYYVIGDINYSEWAWLLSLATERSPKAGHNSKACQTPADLDASSNDHMGDKEATRYLPNTSRLLLLLFLWLALLAARRPKCYEHVMLQTQLLAFPEITSSIRKRFWSKSKAEHSPHLAAKPRKKKKNMKFNKAIR